MGETSATTNGVFISIEMPNGQAPLQFESAKAFEEWLQTEMSTWAGPGFFHLTEELQRALNNLRNAQNKDPEAYPAELKDIARKLQEHYRKETGVTSTSPAGQFILKYAERSREEGLGAAAYYSSTVAPNNIPSNVLRGFVAALLFDHGLTERASAEVDALAVVKANFEIQLQHFAGEHKARLGKADAGKARFDDDARSALASLKAELEEERAAFETMRTEADERLKELEDYFREKTAVGVPAEYWRNRQREYAKSAKWRGCWVATGVILSLCLLWFIWNRVMEFAETPNIENAHWALTAIVATAGSVIFLALRLLTRLYMSAEHLKTDASERVVLTQMYLAFLKDKYMDNEQDRQFILQALFRPGLAGLVREDGVGSIAADMFSSRMGGDSR